MEVEAELQNLSSCLNEKLAEGKVQLEPEQMNPLNFPESKLHKVVEAAAE